jgi:hypothetical protein
VGRSQTELLGDAQVAANIRAWAFHGFMRALVERATAAGFEVWATASVTACRVVSWAPRWGVSMAETQFQLFPVRVAE